MQRYLLHLRTCTYGGGRKASRILFTTQRGRQDREAIPLTQLRANDAPVTADRPDAADLTADDHLAVDTVKDAPGDQDADLPCPDQDPAVVPPSAVDENGRAQ